MWLNYLNYLCEVVKPFVKKRLKDVSYDNFENNLKKLKLKGVFERYRLKLIEKELKKIIKNKTDLKNSLKNGASFENIPNIDNNFIIIRNTNGNESLELVINTEEGNKNFCYGIEWQTGSVRVFIKWNKTNKIGEGSPSRVDHNHFYPHIGKRMMGTPGRTPCGTSCHNNLIFTHGLC